MRVRHSEYFGEIGTANSIFTVTGNSPYAINPANDAVFPWLSPIALRYETYKFHKLDFRYETMVSTSTGGAIFMAVDYDATDPAPTSKQNFLSYKSAVRGPVWQAIRHVCDPKDLHKIPQRNTLNQAPPPGQDPRLYNVGNLFTAYESVSPASNGELWVDYDVEFQTPQMTSDTGPTTINLFPGNGNTNPLYNATINSASKVPLATLKQNLATGLTDLVIGQAGTYIYDSVIGSTGTAGAAADAISVLSGVASVVSSALPFSGAAGSQVGVVGKTGQIITVTQAPAEFGIAMPTVTGSNTTLAGSKITLMRAGSQ